jgi:hypothetical protein
MHKMHKSKNITAQSQLQAHRTVVIFQSNGKCTVLFLDVAGVTWLRSGFGGVH